MEDEVQPMWSVLTGKGEEGVLICDPGVSFCLSPRSVGEQSQEGSTATLLGELEDERTAGHRMVSPSVEWLESCLIYSHSQVGNS